MDGLELKLFTRIYTITNILINTHINTEERDTCMDKQALRHKQTDRQQICINTYTDKDTDIPIDKHTDIDSKQRCRLSTGILI